MVFKVMDQRELPDIQSQGIIYEHSETGAKVFYIKNQDKNKTFSIGFKTPPESDNGIAHIIEHSVLNGSKKYPSKEPFVELIKGSLNTFVNAMTFSDKTIYPVASTNAKDFFNLMSVYLDAVFEPNMLEDPQILAQEGWHYHLEKPEDDLIYKGVVYNEMKGANAAPERQLNNIINRNLLEGSPYQWDSGGDSNAIPNLNHKEFVAFHQKYYHPSNSFTVFYGDLDIDQCLNMLEEYFDRYQKQAESVNLTALPNPNLNALVEGSYSIVEGDSVEDKDYLAMTWYVAKPEEILDGFGLVVLTDILFGNNESPLKKALLDAGIGGDISGDYDEIGYPRLFNIVVKYTQAVKMDQFRKIVNQTLKEIVDQGLDPQLIKASLNKINFQLKEMVISESSPRGVIYAIEVYASWLYQQEPYTLLEFSKYLSKLEQLSEQGYFEKLIQHKLLDNPHKLETVLRAQPGKNEEIEANKLAQLQEYKASLSDEEIQTLIESTQSLIERQTKADSLEDLAKIPRLSKADLSSETEVLDLTMEDLFENPREVRTNKFYASDQFTSGIDYISLYFDISDIATKDFSQLKLLAALLGKIETTNYTASQLQMQKDLHTGGIAATIQIFEDQNKEIKPYFVVTAKALEDELDCLLELLSEIILRTQFKQPKEILKRVQKLISAFEQEINFSSHALAASRALSHLSAMSKLSEQVSGIDYFNYLKTVRQELQGEQAEVILQGLGQSLLKVANRNRVNALYIGSGSRASQIKSRLQAFFALLKQDELGSKQTYLPGVRQNEAFVTAQDVNYVAQACVTDGKLKHSGETEVLATLMRYDHLWNNIRVKGGAYGAMYSFKYNGDLVFSSYRDPNIMKTIETYQATGQFISQLDLSEEELDKNIIGTISNYERPLSASDKGWKAFIMHQVGRSHEDQVRVKEEIIASKIETLRAYASNFEEVLADSTIVVIGNKTMIDKEAHHFESIQDLF